MNKAVAAFRQDHGWGIMIHVTSQRAEDIGGAVLIGPRNIALVAVVVFVGHHIAHTALHRLAVEAAAAGLVERSEEHTSELQSHA